MKLVLQSIFTLIILLIGFWLFRLIPTPSNFMNGTSILGLVLYPFAIALYVSMVGILGISVWNLIKFVFKEGDVDEENYDIPISRSTKTYNYQPNFKQEVQLQLNIIMPRKQA